MEFRGIISEALLDVAASEGNEANGTKRLLLSVVIFPDSPGYG